MKIVTLCEVHYIDAKTEKAAVAAAGSQIDLPQDEALRLVTANAARRLTADEIELDQLRAKAAAADKAAAAPAKAGAAKAAAASAAAAAAAAAAKTDEKDGDY